MNGDSNNYRKFNNNTSGSSGDIYKKSAGRKYRPNGFTSVNKYKANTSVGPNTNNVAEAVERARQKRKNENTKNAIRSGLNTAMPGVGEVANNMLKTEQGQKLLDAYNRGDSHSEGIKNVEQEIKKDVKKKSIPFLIMFTLIFLPLLIILVVLSILFKNADSQIYSNVNGGKTDTDIYPNDDSVNPNVFMKYPGIYENVERAAKKVSDEYKVEIDRFLILATLLAPIDNGNVTPVVDGTCGEPECYLFNGEQYSWDDFLSLWGEQAEYLAKAQILTYVSESSKYNVTCGEDETMEQYAKNDLETNEFNFWAIFNPVNWFKGFRNATDAELNAKCIEAPVGKSKIPDVYVLSRDQGIYYNSINSNGERTYIKDPNTGGVYFWNLVNQNGFINVYLSDYLAVTGDEYTDAELYEMNLPTILDLGNYIYLYYESIQKDCDGTNVIKSSIEKVKVTDDINSGNYYEVSLEEYVGGVMAAEFSSGSDEALKAFAILVRSYAISIVGLDGSGVIENSSNNQNYNPNYHPSEDSRITKAVEATKGLIIVKYGTNKPLMTEYDAFCPTRSELEDGFYYLPEGQKDLPINLDYYAETIGGSLGVPSVYLECPCFKSVNKRPANINFNGKNVRFSLSSSSAPTSPAGEPRQSTLDKCWTFTGDSRLNDLNVTEYAWTYKPSGGHGRGTSQYGLKYFGVVGYDYYGLIKLFNGDVTLRRLSSTLEVGECSNAMIKEESNTSDY